MPVIALLPAHPECAAAIPSTPARLSPIKQTTLRLYDRVTIVGSFSAKEETRWPKRSLVFYRTH
jgi:hypothetical protein